MSPTLAQHGTLWCAPAANMSANLKTLQSPCLASPRVATVIRSFRAAQEKRVAGYGEFDRQLQGMIRACSFTEYPAACSTATATFAEISTDARAAIDILKEAGDEAEAAARYAEQIQRLEAEKLTLTAALHLDMIRRRKLVPEEEEEDGTASQNTTVLSIDQSLAQVRDKLQAVVAAINENMEGLAAESADY